MRPIPHRPGASFLLEPFAFASDNRHMKNPPKLVVFSDLDGTLLDHETYRWDAAIPALDRLRALGVPLVLASSKTAAEITLLQREMFLTRYPAIVENGSGVIGLTDQTQEDAYPVLRQHLDRISDDLRGFFRGFGDMTVNEVAALTGLSTNAASLAKTRRFSEPGLWAGNADTLDQFTTALAAHGITAQSGGRFLTLSFGKTKADAMDSIIQVLRPEQTLALGDAPNDIAMLDKADHGVIIANPYRAPLPGMPGEVDGRISRTKDAGPSGWNIAVNAWLDALGLSTGSKLYG